MEIRLGAEAVGRDGKLGDIHRFIMDPKSQRAEQMTIKQGLHGERVISLLRVTRTEGDKVYLDIDKNELNAMALFDEHAYRAPGVNPGTMPIWEQGPNATIDIEMQPGVLEGPLGEGAPARNPAGGTDFTPEDEQQPVISRETNVIDNAGDRIGKVHEFAVDNVTGIPTRITVRRGAPFGHDFNLSPDSIDEYGAEGIELKVGKEQLK